MHKGLKFIFWNVRSLFNKIDSLICELPNLAPDVLNISESWLQMNYRIILLVYQTIASYVKTGLPHMVMAPLSVEEGYVHILNKD